MKNAAVRYLLPIVVALAAAGLPAMAESAPAAQGATHTLKELSFLRGSWFGQGKDGAYIEEHWSAPVGDSILGSCRFIQNGRTSFYELLSIVIQPEGIVLRMRHFNDALVGWTEKSEAGDCPLVVCTKDEVIFDNNNKEHDVKVTYRRTGPKSLTATVDVTRDEKTTTYSFQYSLQENVSK
ncbi:MAG TPA: DUF6265 family protein [Planktothrix sp.]|jgi:hypothetical protein